MVADRFAAIASHCCSIIGATVVVGMWLERFMLILTSLYRSYLPSVGRALLADRVGLAAAARCDRTFLGLFLLFVRLLPVLSVFELRKRKEHGA